MISFVTNHPWWTMLIVWGIVTVICLILGWMRARNRPPEEDMAPRVTLRLEDEMTPQLERAERLLERLPMRNRFLRPDDAPGRASILVEQIVHDQAVAHEKPGAVVTDPTITPDATTLYHLRESVDKFTFIIGKEGFMGISEAMLDGSETPVYEVPEQWREPMSILVFEVARLRHGR